MCSSDVSICILSTKKVLILDQEAMIDDKTRLEYAHNHFKVTKRIYVKLLAIQQEEEAGWDHFFAATFVL